MRILLIVSLACIIISCNEEAAEIGSDFFKSGQLDISYIDSVSVKIGTVPLDEFNTSDASRILIGHNEDAKLGTIDAIAYFRAALPTAIDLRERNISFAYAAVTLKPDGYSYYDTAETITYEAWSLEESIALSDDGFIYNDKTFLTNRKLGSISFSPKPHRQDSIEIKLDDEFGSSLYQRCVTAHTSVQTNDDFIKYIKGFCIAADSTQSGTIMGFDPAMELRLYYFDKTTIPSKLTYISFPSTSGYRSNYIQSNRSKTKLAEAKSGLEYIDSRLTDDESYLQGGTSLALRVSFPHLRNLNRFSNFFITRAVLELWPERDSYDGQTYLESTMTGYLVNYRNVVINETQFGALIDEDTDLGRDTHYTVDVTPFVKYQLSVAELNDNALLFTLPTESVQESVNKICIAGPGKNTKTKLRIYYATITE